MCINVYPNTENASMQMPDAIEIQNNSNDRQFVLTRVQLPHV